MSSGCLAVEPTADVGDRILVEAGVEAAGDVADMRRCQQVWQRAERVVERQRLSERKVVVITGASRGIGAQLSKAYRQIGYQVIANSRSMRESNDPAILVIEGDITRPETAERILGAVR